MSRMPGDFEQRGDVSAKIAPAIDVAEASHLIKRRMESNTDRTVKIRNSKRAIKLQEESDSICDTTSVASSENPNLSNTYKVDLLD
jgi:hypothetical protein